MGASFTGVRITIDELELEFPPIKLNSLAELPSEFDTLIIIHEDIISKQIQSLLESCYKKYGNGLRYHPLIVTTYKQDQIIAQHKFIFTYIPKAKSPFMYVADYVLFNAAVCQLADKVLIDQASYTSVRIILMNENTTTFADGKDALSMYTFIAKAWHYAVVLYRNSFHKACYYGYLIDKIRFAYLVTGNKYVKINRPQFKTPKEFTIDLLTESEIINVLSSSQFEDHEDEDEIFYDT